MSVKWRLHLQTCLANKFVTQVWEGCLAFTLYRLNQFSANRKLAKEGCVTMDSERPIALTSDVVALFKKKSLRNERINKMRLIEII